MYTTHRFHKTGRIDSNAPGLLNFAGGKMAAICHCEGGTYGY